MTEAPLKTPEPRHGAIAWMAGNPVTANLLMLVLLAGGLLFALRIKQEVFPEFELDIVTVTVAYPGASPDEVEQGIILAIEESIRGVSGVEQVSSSAREGVGTVSAELLLGANPQKVKDEIQQEVDRITSFPDDAEEPQVTIISRRHMALSVILSGDLSDTVLRELAEQVRDRFLSNPNISLIELTGTRPMEIAIEIPKARLRAYNLTLGDVSRIVRNATVELPGGGIKTDSGEILVRVKERRNFGREFENVPVVSGPAGNEVLLGDIAEVLDGFEDTDYSASYDREPSISLDVYRIGEQTPVQVADAVRQMMKEIKDELPPGCRMTIASDRSAMFIERMDLLRRNAMIGLVLVLVLLGIFLEARLAFWVTMGIPISFLGAFLILPSFGISINMISMFALLVALGIVVDDAIVVGENIYQHHQEGMPLLEAAKVGAREVAMPVTFSVLTNIVAFMPLFFVPGVMGKIFKNIPAVVVTVFFISLIESLFILPAHLAHTSGRKRGAASAWIHDKQQAFSHWFRHLIRDRFGPIHLAIIRYRYLAIGVALMVLFMTLGYVISGRMGMVMFPKIESDYAIVTAVLPYGSSVKRSKEVRDLLVDAAEKVVRANGGEQLAKGVFASLGGSHSGVSGSHVIEVSIYLHDASVRPIGTTEVVKQWRSKTPAIPGLEVLTFEADRGGPGRGASLTVELSHKDLGVLEAASSELAEMLGEFNNTKDIDDGFSSGKPQFDFAILPAGRSLGLTSVDIARQVRDSFYGSEVLRQQRGRNEIKVVVRLPKRERASEYDLEELIIRTPNGKDVALKEVVRAKRGRAYTTINRREGRRTVTVTANVVPDKDTNLVQARMVNEFLPSLVRKYPGLGFGFEGKQADMKESMVSLAWGFLVAMFVVYVLLAIPFNSYAQPAIIMASIPFGVVGAVFGHLLMGYSISIISMMGVVALSGVVVNDSLVLIDFANRARNDGMAPFDAVHLAAIRRFRPIMLTTLTTFGGLAPMIFETSRQARFLIPMAISLGFGILFATIISLLLVPCLYLVIEDVKGVGGGR